ncbi:uncharacterized protein UV8b_07774 [Ustilaginoidea virens]|uniref:Uncharacterized protein n=1 Tax=Ustilaginoidea virens TaxID=1159556 RepID=A0A8E5HXW2_USTVR|nr:uncharacterized protein UV8b_07774 [Ustilaginoidea virens]QUC23533.1 hypothetical protein UV8b_07774 [Ustilaginoidea virens]
MASGEPTPRRESLRDSGQPGLQTAPRRTTLDGFDRRFVKEHRPGVPPIEWGCGVVLSRQLDHAVSKNTPAAKPLPLVPIIEWTASEDEMTAGRLRTWRLVGRKHRGPVVARPPPRDPSPNELVAASSPRRTPTPSTVAC